MNSLSGYIELPVGGKILPFKFGSNAWALFCDKYKLELWEISESGIFGKSEVAEDGSLKVVIPPSLEKLKVLYYCAHKAALLSKGESITINEYAFNDLIDETKDVMTKLQDCMLTSKMLGFTFGELEVEGKKKVMMKK
jgi:hypothetical protein